MYIDFTRKRSTIKTTYVYTGWRGFAKVEKSRDLGVILDCKLNFNSPLDKVINSATRLLGFLKRNSKEFRQVQTKKALYYVLVSSHLELARQSETQIIIVQYSIYSTGKINFTFTRYLAFSASGIYHRQPYSERLDFFRMSSLRDRRWIADLLFLYKIINNKTKSRFSQQN